VQELIDHVIGGNNRVRVLAGEAAVPLTGDAVADHAATAAGAQEVFASPDGLTRGFVLPFGEVPGRVFIGIRSGDAITHAWDLATATGQATDLDPEVAAAVLEGARAVIGESLRGPGRPFGEAQPCDEDRPVADQLAAYLGRRVD
jgi:uncharacterized protein (TIGR03086 family)